MPHDPRLLMIGRSAPTPVGWTTDHVDALPVAPAMVERLRGYDAAVVLGAPGEAPWGAAYLLYLAGVPVRVGRSAEFGGSLLSRCLPADASDAALILAATERVA